MRERKNENNGHEIFPIWVLFLSQLFFYLGSIFVTNENNFYVSTSIREGGGFIVSCRCREGEELISHKKGLWMYFGDYEMTFILT
jgi:hypothetical protein